MALVVDARGHAARWCHDAVRRPIRTGANSLGAVEILEGVQEGDRIVVSGSDVFGDAERVNIN